MIAHLISHVIATATERNRVKQGLQCPECWSIHTVSVPTINDKFYCLACGEQWDKHYFGNEQEDGI